MVGLEDLPRSHAPDTTAARGAARSSSESFGDARVFDPRCYLQECSGAAEMITIAVGKTSGKAAFHEDCAQALRLIEGGSSGHKITCTDGIHREMSMK
jgi:hypothetical protein